MSNGRSETPTLDPVHAEVERVIWRSEVTAVVNAMRSDRSLRIGTPLDYTIEAALSGDPRGRQNKLRPYRFAVEQWHLDAATAPGPPDRV
jgi:hypothetical protein